MIGGGVAGLVSGIALRQAGIDATVFEASETDRGAEIGAYLTIAVNGLDALRAVELERPVRRAAFPTPRIEFFNGRGRRLGDVPIGGTLPDGTVTQSLKRTDLHQVLTEAARERGVGIELGKRLVDVETTPAGELVAHFADGTRVGGDLLVGADGIHSRVRTLIDQNAPSPRYTGLGNVGGFSRTDLDGVDAGVYRMIFGKRCFFGYLVSPTGEIWWFGNPPRPTPLSANEQREMTTRDWKQILIDLYAEDEGPAVEIVRATVGQLVGSNQYEMPSVPRWHARNMVLIGDAAHAASPTSGQGASMAIEDGVVLARCLRGQRDASSAFRAFEQLRRTRVERVVAFGAERNAGKMPGVFGRAVRDLVLPTLFKRHSSPKAMAELSWLFDHRVDWNDDPPRPT